MVFCCSKTKAVIERTQVIRRVPANIFRELPRGRGDGTLTSPRGVNLFEPGVRVHGSVSWAAFVRASCGAGGGSDRWEEKPAGWRGAVAQSALRSTPADVDILSQDASGAKV